ncbi:hypothetical protein BC833DRAFT_576120 [Globomyces pollinis-pini]|nr:hypothetical protein BC833DRAFT_576120 [Globomyces pollinis-pini]
MFKDVKLFVVNKDLNKTQSKIVLKRFKEHGGHIVKSKSDATHILVKVPTDKNHIDPNWISDSIINGKLIHIQNTTKPIPSSSNQEPIHIESSDTDLDGVQSISSDTDSDIFNPNEDFYSINKVDKKRKLESDPKNVKNIESDPNYVQNIESDPRSKIIKRRKNDFSVAKFIEQFAESKPTSNEEMEKPKHNQIILMELDRLLKRYTAEGDQWRVKAYKTAINIIRSLPNQIKSGAEAYKIKGIGKKIAEKIQEILDTGTLRKNQNEPESVPVLIEFTKIYGVGPAQAQAWYREGMRTIDDIKHRNDLTHAQTLGLEYFDDLNCRIPREEVGEIGKLVDQMIKEKYPSVTTIIGGSYRRGKKDCGDIDILMYSTKPKSENVLKHIIEYLEHKGLITHVLVSSDSILRGICCLNNGKQRRIDLLWIKKEELGAALIYFTGNDIFNRKLRFLAKKKGLSLNHHGLYKDVVRIKGKKSIKGERIAGESEEEIFQILGVPYKPPTERNLE